MEQRNDLNAIITGASTGLGRALATDLARSGWWLTIDARHPDPLETVRNDLSRVTRVQAVAGDLADADHRERLLVAAVSQGPIDLIVNNASDLGGSPPPRLRDLEPERLERLLAVNVAGPHQLVRAALARLAQHAVILTISSDAAIEHYDGWGGYGASKAALDHLTLTWAAEEPQHVWYAVDPGDMRTAMHQAAFPGEDISDRPEPESVTPTLLRLIRSGLPSGRYRAADLADRLLDTGEHLGLGQQVPA